MPNENDRCVVACAIARGDLAHNRVSFSVIVDARVDAMLRDRRGELIHAKQKNIHQAAHQINMGRGAASWESVLAFACAAVAAPAALTAAVDAPAMKQLTIASAIALLRARAKTTGLDVKARVRFVDMPDSLDPCVLSEDLGQSVHVAPLYVG
jgi:hypothetical protein